jgi:hypothetical protein
MTRYIFLIEKKYLFMFVARKNVALFFFFSFEKKDKNYDNII